jgi:hypothetical protein
MKILPNIESVLSVENLNHLVLNEVISRMNLLETNENKNRDFLSEKGAFCVILEKENEFLKSYPFSVYEQSFILSFIEKGQDLVSSIDVNISRLRKFECVDATWIVAESEYKDGIIIIYVFNLDNCPIDVFRFVEDYNFEG